MITHPCLSGQPLVSVLAVIKLSIPTPTGSEFDVGVGTCASLRAIISTLLRIEKEWVRTFERGFVPRRVVVFENCAGRDGQVCVFQGTERLGGGCASFFRGKGFAI